MIRIYLSDTAYENDIYPLVKAFYPEEDIKVSEITDKNMDVCAGTGNDSASTIRISIECGSAGIFITDGTGKGMSRPLMFRTRKRTGRLTRMQ